MRQSRARRRRYDHEQNDLHAWRFIFIATFGLILNSLLPGVKSGAQADSSNAKPGAWEMTHKGLSSGMLLRPDVLAKMPPEQRSTFERAMQAEPAKPAAVRSNSA